MTRAELEAAAAEMYPHWVLDPSDERGEDYSEMDAKWQNAEADMQRAAYIQGRLDALPEVPDDAVIEAMAAEIGGHWENARMHEGVWREHWCCCDSGGDYSPEHEARAAHAALRGAMQ